MEATNGFLNVVAAGGKETVTPAGTRHRLGR